MGGQNQRPRKKPVRKLNRILFTQGFVESLEPKSTRQRFYDQKTHGLMIEVMPSGSKVFRFFKKINGKQQWSTIGNFPEMSLEEARGTATVMGAQIFTGADFKQTRQDKKEELTLEELADFYFDQYADGRCRTHEDMRKDFRRWFENELPLKLSVITGELIQIRINRLTKDSSEVVKGGQKRHIHRANKALDHIKAIYGWGVRKKLVKENVAREVDGFPTESRTRIVEPHEFGPLLEAIESLEDVRMKDYFKVLLFTGIRSGKVMSMQWVDLSLELRRWQIGRNKNGEPQYVGLSDEAFEILERRSKSKELNPWVFPGGQIHKPTNSHLKEDKNAWSAVKEAAAEIQRRAGVPPSILSLRPHDLRRTVGSYMAMNQTNTATIMQQMGHKSIQAAAIYQRVNYLPAKLATDKAIETMRRLSEGVNVVGFQLKEEIG